jgi:hypothetical protein
MKIPGAKNAAEDNWSFLYRDNGIDFDVLPQSDNRCSQERQRRFKRHHSFMWDVEPCLCGCDDRVHGECVKYGDFHNDNRHKNRYECFGVRSRYAERISRRSRANRDDNGYGENGTTKAYTIAVPNATVVTALIPSITHTGATISPSSGVARDFTSSQVYTVTAADTSDPTWAYCHGFQFGQVALSDKNTTLYGYTGNMFALSGLFEHFEM